MRGGKWKNAEGYVLYTDNHHYLARDKGSVYEHRAVAYKVYGETLPDCEMCGEWLDWDNCVIDHINEIKDDNRPENLRPLCRKCNLKRGLHKSIEKQKKKAIFLTHDGITKPLKQWARELNVSDTCIRLRLKNGWSVSDAVTTKSYRRKTQIKLMEADSSHELESYQ